MRLKSYVRAKSHPEGSITENYIFDESLTFCSRYLHGCSTRFNRRGRHDDGTCQTINKKSYLSKMGRHLLGKRYSSLDYNSWIQAHRYVLFNFDQIGPYLQ